MTTQTYTEQYDYIYDLLVDKELDEELLDFLYHVPNHEDQMVMIKHPHFSFTIILQHDGEMGIEYQINRINKSFPIKKEMIEKCKVEGDWSSYFILWVEKPFRFSEFLKYKDKLTDEEYWETLGDVFISTEIQTDRMDEWIEVFNSQRPNREYLMTDDEDLDFFNQLPDQVEIWRGVRDKDWIEGLSWTTDKEQGEWFVKSRGFSVDEHILCNGWIEKDKILMSSQHENLIVCNPKDITDLKTENVKEV